MPWRLLSTYSWRCFIMMRVALLPRALFMLHTVWTAQSCPAIHYSCSGTCNSQQQSSSALPVNFVFFWYLCFITLASWFAYFNLNYVTFKCYFMNRSSQSLLNKYRKLYNTFINKNILKRYCNIKVCMKKYC